MNLKQIAKDTAKVLMSYLTYQAVRTVIAQLSETNPPQAIWLSQFSGQDKIQDGEVYLEALGLASPELALRIMTLRAHLAEEVTSFLPEMVQTGIQQSNMEHRRQFLERITQLSLQAANSHPEAIDDADTPDLNPEG
ncbi:chaperonin family protein RbcX [Trichothermofontia sichuanensis B231]|uniref:RuBisCO chaperone RbcX n=1 Tax=Trichothermofontia sichuanensis TaxID=3045816 RepID=UPI00224728BC|nr:chaperonin family protein RbcX [Trichothermofontia sichuanensis]UZQ53204.1 chaperonin family protein RbcX [Trichothermofontia sichuanensis B231]